MFSDPSMGGQIYNPWRVQAPILQRFNDVNPSGQSQQGKKQEQGGTNFRFYGGGQPPQPINQMHQVFRSFF